jgi:hypothetical protein
MNGSPYTHIAYDDSKTYIDVISICGSYDFIVQFYNIV